MIRVALLFDPKNNWIEYYYPKFLNNFSNFEFQKVESVEEVSDFNIVFVLGYTKLLDEKFLKFVFIKYPNYLCKPHLLL